MHETIEITALASGGAGVGRVGNRPDGKVAFVPFTAPGDEASIEIIADKKSFLEARLAKILKPSPLRTEPLCPVYGRCGGCQWQHVSYSAQLEWKWRIFVETMKRIGRVEFSDLALPLAAPLEYGYRSRARFHVSPKAWGFHESGTNTIVDIEACPLLVNSANETFIDIKRALSGKVPALASIEIGFSAADKKTTAIFHLNQKSVFDWPKALSSIRGLKGFEVRISPKKRGPQSVVFTHGDTRLVYGVDDVSIEATLGVFTQVNLLQNRMLVNRALEYARPANAEKGAVAIDLFSGVGNFSIPLSRRFKKVMAIEESREATRFAVLNAGRNAASNVESLALPAHGWLVDVARTAAAKPLAWGKTDVVVLDPPRGGDMPVARALKSLSPERIVYVSCAPATLARDVAALVSEEAPGAVYRPKSAGVIDMFPQTHHIESVVCLEKVKE